MVQRRSDRAWAAEPRTTRGGQPWHSAPAILTALTLRAVFRLAYRQAKGLTGPIMGLLGPGLRAPDYTALSRRSATLAALRRPRPGIGADGKAEPLHLLVDSTGLKLCGPGEWRKLHLGVGAETGRIVAASLTAEEVDDGAEAGALLDQVDGAVASFAVDGRYDHDGVPTAVAERHPEAAIITPPRARAARSGTAGTAPAQRGRHLRHVEPRGSPDIAEHGRMAWQKASGYTGRARAEAATGRWKRVIGDGLRAHTDERRATGVEVAVYALNRMLELGRPNYARTP